MLDRQRRKLMLGLSTALAMGYAGAATALVPTPRQTAGPFYPDRMPLDKDNDLTQISGKAGKAKGIISDISGRIVDINGNPLNSLRIEIWQCDANGRYRHSREDADRPMDNNFQGFGFTNTDSRGQYRFRTIRPVRYPGRTPHIHIAVFPPGERPFITQLYIAGEPRNETDFLYNDIPWDKRELVSAEFKAASSPGAEQQAAFDIILNRSDGTPPDRAGRLHPLSAMA